jgi:hypothetical protein
MSKKTTSGTPGHRQIAQFPGIRYHRLSVDDSRSPWDDLEKEEGPSTQTLHAKATNDVPRDMTSLREPSADLVCVQSIVDERATTAFGWAAFRVGASDRSRSRSKRRSSRPLFRR